MNPERLFDAFGIFIWCVVCGINMYILSLSNLCDNVYYYRKHRAILLMSFLFVV